jgi:hypothetical protein
MHVVDFIHRTDFIHRINFIRVIDFVCMDHGHDFLSALRQIEEFRVAVG